MSHTDVKLGPVDYLVVAFPAGQANFSGEMTSELRALMDSNTLRVLDLVVLTKDVDGSVEASELRDVDDSVVGQLHEAERDLAVLLAESDIDEIGRRIWSPAARLRCWYGRTSGRCRSGPPSAGPVASW